MRVYVYGCPNKEHPRDEIVHSIDANLWVVCTVCGSRMERIPQAPMAIAHKPIDILYDYLDRGYADYRSRQNNRRKRYA